MQVWSQSFCKRPLEKQCIIYLESREGGRGGGGREWRRGDRGGNKGRILESTEKGSREFATVKITEGEVKYSIS